MSRARDKPHILLLSIFLCACILFIVYRLIGERNIEAGQDTHYWVIGNTYQLHVSLVQQTNSESSQQINEHTD